MDVVDVLPGSKSSQASVCDQSEDRGKRDTSPETPHSVEDSISDISQPVNEKGEGRERKKDEDEGCPRDA